MYQNKFKLAIFIILLLAAALACTTITGEDPPTDTPVPPPTEALLPTEAIPPTEAPPPTEAAPPTESAPTTGAEILFQDDFSDSNSGWDIYSDSEGTTEYINGQYRISIFTTSFFYWANPYRNFTDVIVEVTVQKTTENDDVQMGIICRHEDVENWYALVITGDGFAAVRKRYQGSDLEVITDWADVAASVNSGAAVNNLRAECIGNRLSLFANGQLVIETFDSDIPAGDVGLLAGTFENADNLEALFDNFVVYRP